MPSPSRASGSTQVIFQRTFSGNIRLPASPPRGTSSPQVSPRKRKYSELSTDTPPCSAGPSTPKMANKKSLSLPIPSPHALKKAKSKEPIPDPPSPVPTEIIDNDADDFVRTSKQHGVKVRDFCHEPQRPTITGLPEVWGNPLHTLLAHDVHVRRPRDTNFFLSGKQLRRLLDIGYVSMKEAELYWTPEDWENLREYDSRVGGPYPYVISKRHARPTAQYRAKARQEIWPMRPTDTPDEKIYVPEDEPGLWEGDPEEKDESEEERVIRLKERSEQARLALLLERAKPPKGTPFLFEYWEFPLSQPAEDTPSTPPRPSADLPATPPLSPSLPVAEAALPASAVTPPASPVEERPRKRMLTRTKTYSLISVR